MPDLDSSHECAMRKSLTRRQAIRRLAGTAVGAMVGAAPYGFVRAAVNRPSGRRALIVGGGFGGAAVAAELRRIAPGFETMLIEQAESFFCQPASLDVAFGRRTLAEATRSYGSLDRAGVRLAKTTAAAVDVDRRLVSTAAGAFAYDALVLASGIRLIPDRIQGLAAAPDADVSLYDRGRLPELKRRIESLGAGTAVISIPSGAIKCPPAPYEFALQLAEQIKARRTRGKVIVLDAWPAPQPGPLTGGLAKALAAHADTIEYVAPVNVARIDGKARRVHTAEGDEFTYDLLSLVPPHSVHEFVADLRLAAEGDLFVDVDPITQRARESETVYAVGDVARVPFGKTAAAAVGTARLCARAVARALGAAAVPDPAAGRETLETECYPQVSSNAALGLVANFSLAPRKDAPPEVSAKTTAGESATAANLDSRRTWEASTLKGIFGS